MNFILTLYQTQDKTYARDMCRDQPIFILWTYHVRAQTSDIALIINIRYVHNRHINHIFITYISAAVCGSLLYRFFSIISWGVRLAVITSLFFALLMLNKHLKYVLLSISMVGIHHRCYYYDYIITVTNSQSIMPWLHPIYTTLTMIAMIAWDCNISLFLFIPRVQRGKSLH